MNKEKDRLRLKAIENQMTMDFSPLMVKYGIYDQSDLREFMSNVSINTPKHETVEEWEIRTGDSYPDDAPVWVFDGTTWNINLYWWKGYDNFDPKKTIVSNHHGKPEIEG